MSYTGQVVNGVVVVDPSANLPEGALVRVELLQQDQSSQANSTKNLLDWAGKGQDLPDDLAENHDHYLHGLPNGCTDAEAARPCQWQATD